MYIYIYNIYKYIIYYVYILSFSWNLRFHAIFQDLFKKMWANPPIASHDVQAWVRLAQPGDGVASRASRDRNPRLVMEVVLSFGGLHGITVYIIVYMNYIIIDYHVIILIIVYQYNLCILLYIYIINIYVILCLHIYNQYALKPLKAIFINS